MKRTLLVILTLAVLMTAGGGLAIFGGLVVLLALTHSAGFDALGRLPANCCGLIYASVPLVALVQADVRAWPIPSADAVLLIDLLHYYFRGPQQYYLLPVGVPPDQARTETELQAIVQRHPNVWAVLWGEGEADSGHLVERWLDGHAYKTTNPWYGGIRLARYVVSVEGQRRPVEARFGDSIEIRTFDDQPGGCRDAGTRERRVEWKDIAESKYKYGPELLYTDASKMQVGDFRTLTPPMPSQHNIFKNPPMVPVASA
jgi:hypothetical protein